MCINEFKKDNLVCRVFANRDEMGKAAAQDAAAVIRQLLAQQDEINMVFAAAPSQNDVLKHLLAEDVDWSRINAFHMDEYIGLEGKFEKTFGYYLKTTIFDKVPFKSVNYVGSGDVEQVCARYTQLLSSRKIDVVLCGIGENAHLAFNDPPVADFKDPAVIKAVKLDQVCRNQQVNDKTFDTLDEVPQYAVTLTIPTMVSAKHMFCVVPTDKKAQAVYDTMNAEISEAVPASIMRTHPSALMYTDAAAGELL
jgi:glucosamine-6-phosphate deaminase